MFIPTLHFWQQLLVNAKAGTPSPGLAGVLTGAKIMLYKSSVILSNATLLGDLTLADYNTYAAQNAVFGTPYQRQAGGMAVLSAQLQFQMTDLLAPNTIFGYGVTDAAGAFLLGAESFGIGGIPLATILQAINLVVEIAVGGPDWGAATIDF